MNFDAGGVVPPEGGARAAEPPLAVEAEVRDDRDEAAAFHIAVERIKRELSKRIVGQREVIDLLLTAMFARGHVLLIGVPGLAKTLLVSTLSRTMSLRFGRIQFTPDLMPSDIIGSDLLEEDAATGKRVYRFVKGPLFCNLLLADEVNRTPAKTQAALLQAMQEYEVTAGGTTYALAMPFLVFATQNPIEQEGTYQLPEAQLDRFMMNIRVPYPDQADEYRIVEQISAAHEPDIEQVISPGEVERFQNLVLRVPAAPSAIRVAVEIVRRTRVEHPDAPDAVKDYVRWGAGPRASQHLVLAAKSRSLVLGSPGVSEDDVRTLAFPILGHRLVANFRAEAEGVKIEDVVGRVVESVG